MAKQIGNWCNMERDTLKTSQNTCLLIYCQASINYFNQLLKTNQLYHSKAPIGWTSRVSQEIFYIQPNVTYLEILREIPEKCTNKVKYKLTHKWQQIEVTNCTHNFYFLINKVFSQTGIWILDDNQIILSDSSDNQVIAHCIGNWLNLVPTG